jgi:hypothetical protein
MFLWNVDVALVLLLLLFTGWYRPRCRSRGSSVSTVSGYGLDDRAIGVRSRAGAQEFSSLLCVQTGSGAHPASCTMGTGGPFPGGKARPGRDDDRPPLPVPRSWVSRSYTSSPPSASMACSGTALLFFIVQGVPFTATITISRASPFEF